MEDDRFACARWSARRVACPPRDGSRLRLVVLGAAFWLGTAAAAPALDAAATAHGPLPDFTLPSVGASDYWLHLDTGLDVTREALDTHWSSIVRQPDDRPDYSLSSPEGAAAVWSRYARSPAVIDFVPTHMLASDPQRDYRPQFALGGSSTSLNALLRGAGIDASGCLAPLMRMHSTISGNGPRTNVSVSARCNIH
jgi:hypothetical protein